jgi:hypothetical protein
VSKFWWQRIHEIDGGPIYRPGDGDRIGALFDELLVLREAVSVPPAPATELRDTTPTHRMRLECVEIAKPMEEWTAEDRAQRRRADAIGIMRDALAISRGDAENVVDAILELIVPA